MRIAGWWAADRDAVIAIAQRQLDELAVIMAEFTSTAALAGPTILADDGSMRGKLAVIFVKGGRADDR